jgi:hypothetical protein
MIASILMGIGLLCLGGLFCFFLLASFGAAAKM